MKLNKIMILAIFLLALVTLGVASAADENMTESQIADDIGSSSDVLTQEDSVQNTLNDENEVTEPGEVSYVFPEEVYAGEYFTVNITVPGDAGGQLIYPDGGTYEEYYLDGGSNLCNFKFWDLGENTLTLRFLSNDPNICKDSYRQITYNVTEYGCVINSTELIYGNSAKIDVSFPMPYGTGVIYINGIKMQDFDIAGDKIYDYSFFIPVVNTSQINVTVDYKGYKDIKAKVYNKVLEVEPKIIVPSELIFNQKQSIAVEYGDGENVNVLILEDDGAGGYTIVSNETLITSNGKATYAIPVLEFGKVYAVEILVGNLYNEYRLEVIPNLNIPNAFWSKKNYTSTFEFPIEYANRNIRVSTSNLLIFEGNLSADAKVNVTICPTDLPEDASIYVNVVDKDTGDEYYYEKYGIHVRDEDPSAVEIRVANEEKTTIQGDFIQFDVSGVPTDECEVNVLVNGTPVEIQPDLLFHQFGIPTADMKPGIYNITIIYPGDGYFEPKSKEFTAEIALFRVDIPENMSYNTGDAVFVLFTGDATGTLTVSVDGKQVKKFDVATEYDQYDDGSSSHSFRVFIQDYGWPLGNHTVNVKYKGNKGSFDVKKVVNLGYSIYFEESDEFEYGYKNIVTVYVPEDAKGSFNITVNGKPFTKFTREEGEIRVDISEFFGETVVGVAYPGDAKYKYPIKVNQTFYTKASFVADIEKVGYKDKLSFISLKLPKDAKGNLVVEVDGVTYAKGSFKDGEAKVSLSDLALGQYSVKAYYDGDDYEVKVLEKEMTVEPTIQISAFDIKYGESADVYINLPNGANGTLQVRSDVGFKSQQKMVNGFAKVTLSGLPVNSEIYIDASFVYDDGSDISQTFYLAVYPNYVVSENMTVFGKNTVSLNANKDLEGYFLVSVDYEKDYEAEISNGKATISLPDLTAGEHTLLFRYRSEDESYNFHKEILINVSKAANPKLVPVALSVYYTNYYIVKAIGVDGLPLKNVKIYFTIGKNTFKRYTDANGQAILKMAYKPGKYVVVAQYSKKVKITNKVKVVGVATLYKVNVKKSAKKLVLVATLKKGTKAIKNAKVYFTFNGKTYKAVTSKNGIATATVKKADLNRLKVGKTVAYQVIYGKNVVKYTAKVRK